MGERTSYTPGTFSWAELVTSDAGAAKGFYTELFGWEYDDNPAGEGQIYSMAKRDGHSVAALYPGDQPPNWNCYVTVTSADETAQKAQDAGGSIMAEPFDVMDVGRMAVISDPVGAALCVWEPRASIGATLVNTPGSMTWNDLVTSDPDAAEAFYGAVFGWTFQEFPDSGGYRVIRNGEHGNGGIMPMEQTPPNWMPYFGHDDTDRLAGEIGDLGGRLYNGPVHLPQGTSGTIAVLRDPQGAVFATFTGPFDD